ncbi:hypothetical protein N431DRAFT_468834 [Stipitochalara longipes BDJ]|nr:hypothetical protein N431DRAFT_468834 [Stipitochalara longipes BDJ]
MSHRKSGSKGELSSKGKEEPRSNFEFVSVVPTKDGRTKPNREGLVRKNAARYQWKKSKAAKASVGKTVVKSTTGQDSPVIEDNKLEVPIENQVTGHSYAGPHGPRSALQTYYLWSANDGKVARIMAFTSRVILPAIMPSTKPNVDHPGIKAMVQMICNDSLLFQIWRCHTEIHQRAKFGYPLIEECDFLLLYGQIIKSLNERMRSQTDIACSDASILCVLGVTTYGTLLAKPPGRMRWPSQGPLTNLNALDTLGRLPSILEHINGLDLLVGIRGGIHNITTPGIAPMISIIDIIGSTRLFTPAKFPHVPWNEQPVLCESLGPVDELPNSMPSIGRGFPEEWKHSEFQPLQILFINLRYIASYTVVVYNHCQGIAIQSTGTLTDQRNAIQHRILCMPAYPYEQCTRPIYQFYESTRLAAQMYSLLCIYPYPPGPAPFGELANRLRRELAGLDLITMTNQESKLLLWILFMGSIMVLGTPDRFCFVSALSTIAQSLQLESWQDAKSILTTFLWLDMTSDIDGKDVWDEVSSRRYSVSTIFSSPSPSLRRSVDGTIPTFSRSSAEAEELSAAGKPLSRPQ